ncbi:hypothetical protein Aperf_G00000043769 [Anoplocephala perfoliata]
MSAFSSACRRVACAISGGVDSAVSAYLVKRKGRCCFIIKMLGYDVVGVFMTNWDQQDEKMECTVDADREDARYVSQKLGIDFVELNFVKEYWNDVFSKVVEVYTRGKTPNPDILCNRYVKFEKLVDLALKNSPNCHPSICADAFATGHYAQNSFGNFLELRHKSSSRPMLLRSVDRVKDQTFWLCNISWRHLQYCMFPIGNLTKPKVKEIAASIGLERIVKKKESTGICFIGKRKFCNFIDKKIPVVTWGSKAFYVATLDFKTQEVFVKKIESEIPTDTMGKVRDQLESAAKKLKEESENLIKQEYVRKSIEGLSKASEQLADVSRAIGKTEFVKSARESLEALEKELQSDRALVYRAPEKPRTRAEITGSSSERVVDADTESSGIVLHKDSKWIAAWENFKDNNQYVQKFFDLRTKYEESDHLLVRSIRIISEKITDLVGSRTSENELQTVLEEISKIDPSFTTEKFVRYCHLEVIPNVLESIVHGHLEILKDWCYEASYNVLAAPIKQTQELGFHMDSRILDIHNVDLCMGKMMEQGPVLIITFQAQQIQCIRDSMGAVREGNPEKVLRVTHVWALCRDQSELNPWMAWRVLDVAMMPSEQWM